MPIIQIKVNPQAIRRVVQVGIQGPAGQAASTQNIDDRIAVAITQTVESDATILIGQPLYLKPSGHADLADASHIGTCKVCGLASTGALATFAVTFNTEYLDLADWSAITGTPFLAPGTFYFLGEEQGTLTPIAPETTGHVVAIVGIALSPTKLAIDVQSPILL